MTNELDLLQTLKVAFIAEIPLFSAETALFEPFLDRSFQLGRLSGSADFFCQSTFTGITFVQKVFEMIMIAYC